MAKNTIVAAAIRVNGRLYTGTSHAEAAQKAEDAGEKIKDIEKAYDLQGKGRVQFPPGAKFSTGFMTKSGQYVSREDALKATNYETAEDIQTIYPKAMQAAQASSSGTWSQAI